jgi:hypothetical protein
VRDQKLDPLGMVGRIKRDREPFGGGGVIPDEHGIIVPLLMQAGEIDHPVARYPALDQVNRDALLLGADHTDDFCGHGCFPGPRCCSE